MPEYGSSLNRIFPYKSRILLFKGNTYCPLQEQYSGIFYAVSEVADQICSTKWVLGKISQISQESNPGEDMSSFRRLQTWNFTFKHETLT